MPKMDKQYQLILGTFIDNKFVWHDVDSYDDLDDAYREFKKYVNSQLKYTDEELVKVWNTGRLDVELRRGNRLLNWVGIYAREVAKGDDDDDKDEGDDKDEKKPAKGPDGAPKVKDSETQVNDERTVSFTWRQYRAVLEGLRKQKADPSITNTDIARAAGVSRLTVERIKFRWQFVPEKEIPFIEDW